MMEKVIEPSHFTKEYKNLKAIDDLSFNVYQGEILGLLGPNGCGKSTTINSILSLLKYQEGFIKVFGKEMKPDSYDLKAKIGVIFQEVAVFDELNVYDNINYLVPDIPVVVRGKLDKSDDNNKIIADKVIGLEDYTPEFCIIVKPEQEDNAFFSKITETLQENAGPCPVYMYFMSSKKMIKGNREFWIDGSETVVNNLKNLLGKNSIKQR